MNMPNEMAVTEPVTRTIYVLVFLENVFFIGEVGVGEHNINIGKVNLNLSFKSLQFYFQVSILSFTPTSGGLMGLMQT